MFGGLSASVSRVPQYTAVYQCDLLLSRRTGALPRWSPKSVSPPQKMKDHINKRYINRPTLTTPMIASRFTGFRSSVSRIFSILDGCSCLRGYGIFRSIPKAEKTPEQSAYSDHFWSKTPVLVLLLTSTGCSVVTDICQDGIFAGLLFIGTAAVAFLISLSLTGIFYSFQYRKLKGWDLINSSKPPQCLNAWVFPIGFIVVPVCFIALFSFADCSDAQRVSHILGVLVGWPLGFAFTGLYFFSKTRGYYN